MMAIEIKPIVVELEKMTDVQLATAYEQAPVGRQKNILHRETFQRKGLVIENIAGDMILNLPEQWANANISISDDVISIHRVVSGVTEVTEK